MAELVDHTERLVRQRDRVVARRDGDASRTILGSDGIDVVDVPITATVTIAGDEVTVDLTESSPMVRGSLNSTRSFVQACVYQAVRCALEVEVPNTSGAFRPVNVLTKPGTVCEVTMPGASSMRGVTGFRVLDAVNGALAQLIPDRVPAAGEGGNTLAIFGAERPEGGGSSTTSSSSARGARRPCADGNDGVTNPASLAANIPVEVAESEFPIVVERYGLVPDSGGPGLHRGGLAIERAWRCLTPDTSLIVRSDRASSPPYGLAGGGAGRAVVQRPPPPGRGRGGAARRCSRPRSRRATSTSTASRVAAASATRSSATRCRSGGTWRTTRCRWRRPRARLRRRRRRRRHLDPDGTERLRAARRNGGT